MNYCFFSQMIDNMVFFRGKGYKFGEKSRLASRLFILNEC